MNISIEILKLHLKQAFMTQIINKNETRMQIFARQLPLKKCTKQN